MRKLFILIFSLIYYSSLSQTACETTVCYGQPIKLTCNKVFFGGCGVPGSTYNWTNTSGSWTKGYVSGVGDDERLMNVVINVGGNAYVDDRFYLSVQYPEPPGGFSGGSVKITSNPQIIASGTSTNNTCSNQNDGTITLTSVTGGSPPYTYNWSGPNSFTSSSQNITNLFPGNYKVTITDRIGCTNVINKLIVNSPPETYSNLIYLDTVVSNVNYSITSSSNMSMNIIPTVFGCSGNCNATILTNVTGGVPPYTYLWSGPNSFTSNLVDLDSLCLGTYYLTVTDNIGCIKQDSVILVGGWDVDANIVSTRCNIPNSGAIYLTPNCSTSTYTYLWNTGNTERIHYNLSSGNYHVTITNNSGDYKIKHYTIN